MNGKTHEAVAILSCLALYHNDTVEETVIGCAVALTAATLADIDLVDNRTGKGVMMLLEVVHINLTAIGFMLINGAGLLEIALWLGPMVVYVLQPHRGLTHHIETALILSVQFSWLTNKSLFKWFLVAYMSHILIDLLNKKKVNFLLGYRFCLGWVKAGSIIDNMIGLNAALAAIVIAAAKINGIDIIEMIIKEVIG